MNGPILRQSAEAFEAIATKLVCQGDSEVELLYRALEPLLQAVMADEITQPFEWNSVPGDWFFNEGTLRKYRELEAAYAKFKIELTGREASPVLQWLKKSNSSI